MKKIILIFIMTFVMIFPTYIMGYEHQASFVYVDDDKPAWWYDATHVHTIQEGIAAVSSGGNVYVYDGSYEFNDGGNNLEIHKSLSINGQSTAGVILTSVPTYETGFECYNNWVNISHLTMTGASEGFISEGTINHINISYCNFINSARAIFLTKVNNFSAYNNFMTNLTDKGLFIPMSNDVKICNNILVNVSEYGFSFGFHGLAVNRVYVFNNYIEQTGYQGMFVRTTSNSNFLNNTLIDCGNIDYPGSPSLRYLYSQCAIHFHNSNNINVKNTYINLSNHSGIYVNLSNNISIYNSIVTQNNHSGIQINNSEYIMIAYCDISNNNESAILVNNSANSTFVYNELYDNKYGVYIK